jgi:hypothetical protein
MTSEFLLESLENHSNMILEKLSNAERNKLTELVRQIMAAADENAIEDAKGFLYHFCLGNPFLKEAILKAEAAQVKPVVFRGKPIPKSLTEKSKRIRLRANRLIDAIEKTNHSPSELKHEKSN